jgi:hypothetical protein
VALRLGTSIKLLLIVSLAAAHASAARAEDRPDSNVALPVARIETLLQSGSFTLLEARKAGSGTTGAKKLTLEFDGGPDGKVVLPVKWKKAKTGGERIARIKTVARERVYRSSLIGQRSAEEIAREVLMLEHALPEALMRERAKLTRERNIVIATLTTALDVEDQQLEALLRDVKAKPDVDESDLQGLWAQQWQSNRLRETLWKAARSKGPSAGVASSMAVLGPMPERSSTS